MPDLLRLRPAAAAAAIVLALLSLAAHPARAELSGSGEAVAGCSIDEVTVVVDFNELGGETRVACHPGGGTAAQVFEASGFPLTYTHAPGMQGYVCSVSGVPKDGPCTEGDSYWSLWWSEGSDDWAYATLGADQLEIEPGGRVGFAWHEGDLDAAPPDVTFAGGDPVAAEGDEAVAEGAPERPDPPAQDAVPTWLLVAGAVVVLGGAAAVPLLRRRS